MSLDTTAPQTRAAKTASKLSKKANGVADKADDKITEIARRAAIDRSRSRRHRCAGHPMRRGDGRRHRGFARALLGAGSVAW